MDAAGADTLSPVADPPGTAATLRAAGLRVTRPRLEVHAALADMGGHRSAEEVVAALRQRGATPSRGSVYNALSALASAGLVMQADVGPGRTVYEVAREWHHHFVCRRCGAVMDVACLTGQEPCLEPTRSPGSVDEAQVIFRGVCTACGG